MSFALALVAASSGFALAQSAEERPVPTRTMASLIAEGFEPQTVQIFKDKIWMRKGEGDSYAYICDRGRIGSPAFDAYREKKYDQITCNLAQ